MRYYSLNKDEKKLVLLDDSLRKRFKSHDYLFFEDSVTGQFVAISKIIALEKKFITKTDIVFLFITNLGSNNKIFTLRDLIYSAGGDSFRLIDNSDFEIKKIQTINLFKIITSTLDKINIKPDPSNIVIHNYGRSTIMINYIYKGFVLDIKLDCLTLIDKEKIKKKLKDILNGIIKFTNTIDIIDYSKREAFRMFGIILSSMNNIIYSNLNNFITLINNINEKKLTTNIDYLFDHPEIETQFYKALSSLKKRSRQILKENKTIKISIKGISLNISRGGDDIYFNLPSLKHIYIPESELDIYANTALAYIYGLGSFDILIDKLYHQSLKYM